MIALRGRDFVPWRLVYFVVGFFLGLVTASLTH